jgi:hypothetical protein
MTYPKTFSLPRFYTKFGIFVSFFFFWFFSDQLPVQERYTVYKEKCCMSRLFVFEIIDRLLHHLDSKRTRVSAYVLDSAAAAAVSMRSDCLVLVDGQGAGPVSSSSSSGRHAVPVSSSGNAEDRRLELGGMVVAGDEAEVLQCDMSEPTGAWHQGGHSYRASRGRTGCTEQGSGAPVRGSVSFGYLDNLPSIHLHHYNPRRTGSCSAPDLLDVPKQHCLCQCRRACGGLS